MTNDIKHIISERLLRMGLISQPIKNHSHAIELLAQDIMNHIKVSDDNFKDAKVELKVKPECQHCYCIELSGSIYTQPERHKQCCNCSNKQKIWKMN